MTKVKKFTERNTIELYAEWYLNELKENGFVKEYYREPQVIELTPRKFHPRSSFKETKKGIEEKLEDFTFLRELNYRYDYLIEWDTKAEHIFYNHITKPFKLPCPFVAMDSQDGKVISLIDVKPTAQGAVFGHNTTGYTFPIIQKVLFNFYGIYINKTIPIPMVSGGEIKSGNSQALFTTTFVPSRYLLTDTGKQARQIKYKTQSLKEYLDRRTRELARISNVCSQQTLL